MTSKQPFFSQFVEGQELSEDEIKQVAGGGLLTTFKYPSDNDEGGSGLNLGDESIQAILEAAGLLSFTKKYPSDNDEGWRK